MKEAYVKATGEGLSRPLRSFTVRLDFTEASLTPAPEDARSWALYRIAVSSGFVAALAAEGSGHRICYHFK